MFDSAAIIKNQRYIPHELKTRVCAVKLYRTGVGVDFVCRRYHISKSSLLRWNKRYDGTVESLSDKSHRPHSVHPNAHTDTEIKWIKNYHRRNPNISICELYGKLVREKGYKRHPLSLYRVFVRLGFRANKSGKKKKRKLKTYVTPFQIGCKWQMDVKYVPSDCYTGSMPDKFYQYTVIDECTRERFIFPYMEQSGYSSCDFLKRAIKYFGYKPTVLQTDNGTEFCNIVKTDKIHAFDLACQKLNIEHKRIRPRTPRHNGKVERSHRNDQERFYDFLKFYSLDDLKVQMRNYLKRSNRIPMQVLGWLNPLEFRAELQGLDNWFKRQFVSI